MNASEILALVDDRIALPGQACPTLDDYTAALAEIRQRETTQARASQAYQSAALANMAATNAYQSTRLAQSLGSQSIGRWPRGRFEVWARVHGSEEAFQIGGPNKTFSTRDAASDYASELRQSQPHLDIIVQESS